jgi:hypothetical protein
MEQTVVADNRCSPLLAGYIDTPMIRSLTENNDMVMYMESKHVRSMAGLSL